MEEIRYIHLLVVVETNKKSIQLDKIVYTTHDADVALAEFRNQVEESLR